MRQQRLEPKSRWTARMVNDLATSATYELKERISSRDGEKPIGIVANVLATYLPQDDDTARRGFVRAITDNLELYSVWKAAPKGKKLLLSSVESKPAIQTAANKSLKDAVAYFQSRIAGKRGWDKKTLLNAVLIEMGIKDGDGRRLTEKSAWYRKLESIKGKNAIIETIAKDHPDKFLRWANIDKDDLIKSLDVKQKRRGIKKYVPAQVGSFVVCNTNTIRKPIFLIGKIVMFRGTKADREALVEFADKSLGFKGHVLYPAFSESALGIVAFADVVSHLLHPPFPPLGKSGFKFHDVALIQNALWVSDQALSLYLPKRYDKLAAAVKKRKAALYDIAKIGVRDEAKIDEADADEPGTPVPVRERDWMSPLPSGIKRKLKDHRIKPVEKRVLESVMDLNLQVDEIETSDEGWGEFGLKTTVFGKTVWLSAQYSRANPEGEWDVVDYFSPEKAHVDAQTLDQAISWLQKASKGLILGNS